MHSCYVAAQIVLLCNTTVMVNDGVCVGRHVILNEVPVLSEVEVNNLAVLCGCHPEPKAEVLIVWRTNVILNDVKKRAVLCGTVNLNHVLNWVQDLTVHIWILE